MRKTKRRAQREGRLDLAATGFLETTWRLLSPAERLRRSWRLRRLLKDPQKVHDAKLWPRI